MNSTVILLAALTLGSLAESVEAQYYPYPNPRPRPPLPGLDTRGADTKAVATFNGTFKSVNKKYVVITLDNGNEMQMYLTRTTKFIREGMAAKPTDFHTGEDVTVDAANDARLNLLAVRVEAGKPHKPAPKPEDN